MTLFQYLLDTLAYSLQQKEYGHLGVVVTRSQAKEALGNCTDDDLNLAIFELDNWSDHNQLPSLTCLFRTPVGYGRDLHWFDLHTSFTTQAGLKVQRHYLELVPAEPINGKKAWLVKVKNDLTCDAPLTGNFLVNEDTGVSERELCEKFYGRPLSKKVADLPIPSEKLCAFLR